MINIIFLGAPGSGKGTQSDLLSVYLSIPIISTGEILRNEVLKKSETGKFIKSYIDSGQLVPDKYIIDTIRKKINICNNGFILDGFPRSIEQCEALEGALFNMQKNINLVININVDDDTLVKRLSGRFFCTECDKIYNHFFNRTKLKGVCDHCGNKDFQTRDDDKLETVKNRLKIYHQNTKMVFEFYQRKSLILSFNGLQSISQINRDILSAIEVKSKSVNLNFNT